MRSYSKPGEETSSAVSVAFVKTHAGALEDISFPSPPQMCLQHCGFWISLFHWKPQTGSVDESLVLSSNLVQIMVER